MITPEKIEEWIKEAVERPESAPLLLQFIGNRLRELSQRNEDLLTENIALMTDKRVEEYEQRLAHLEYQLDMLRRQFGGDLDVAQAAAASVRAEAGWAALVATADGRLARIAVDDLEAAAKGQTLLARLSGVDLAHGEAPCLLLVKSSEELLFVFSTGRAAPVPAGSLPLARPDGEALSVDWSKAARPEEPRAGETLVCVAPIARLSLAEYILQASRRGHVKKIRAQMAQSILANRYIGAGTKIPADRSFALALSGKDDRLALVSHDGYLLCLDVRRLPFAIEEVMRLSATDHLVAALPIAGVEAAAEAGERSLIALTQGGKVLQYREADVETATSLKIRGASLFSAQRRGQGVHVIGAGLVKDASALLTLDASGALCLHSGADVLGRGALPVEQALVGMAAG